jgi:hypothetical protein
MVFIARGYSDLLPLTIACLRRGAVEVMSLTEASTTLTVTEKSLATTLVIATPVGTGCRSSPLAVAENPLLSDSK